MAAQSDLQRWVGRATQCPQGLDMGQRLAGGQHGAAALLRVGDPGLLNSLQKGPQGRRLTLHKKWEINRPGGRKQLREREGALLLSQRWVCRHPASLPHHPTTTHHHPPPYFMTDSTTCLPKTSQMSRSKTEHWAELPRLGLRTTEQNYLHLRVFPKLCWQRPLEPLLPKVLHQPTCLT